MSNKNEDDSDSSESEISPSSSSFDPIKALYSSKAKVPIQNAPVYENIQQFEAALAGQNVAPVGHKELVKMWAEEREEAKLKKEKELEEKNRQRFSHMQGGGLTTVERKQRKSKNVLTRMPTLEGPLGALKDCVDRRIRIKVVTRNATSVRGELYATLVAFDKQWNLALTDVLEVWRRKAFNKRKIPPAMGVPVPKGSAEKISPVPTVTECALGHGIFECTRHIPQLLVRGEHVVYVNVIERWSQPTKTELLVKGPAKINVDDSILKVDSNKTRAGPSIAATTDTLKVSAGPSKLSADTSKVSASSTKVSVDSSKASDGLSKVSVDTSKVGIGCLKVNAASSKLRADTSEVSEDSLNST